VTDDELTAARQRLGHRRPTHPRLWTAWWGDGAAAQVAACARVLPLDRTTIAGTSALIDPAPDRKRLAILAYRHGANVSALDGPRIRLTSTVWYEPPPAPPTRGAPRPPPRVVDGDHVEAILRATLPPASTLTVVWPEHRTYRPSPVITLDTDAPAPALEALAAYAATVDARLTVWAAELDRLDAALARVVDDAGR
jgi:predicted nucleic acid-binding Zn ribbon protein